MQIRLASRGRRSSSIASARDQMASPAIMAANAIASGIVRRCQAMTIKVTAISGCRRERDCLRIPLDYPHSRTLGFAGQRGGAIW